MKRRATKRKDISPAEREQVRIRGKLERDDVIYVDSLGRSRLDKRTAEGKRQYTQTNNVIRVRDEDPLWLMVKKKAITSDMYNGGTRYRNDYEASQQGKVRGAAMNERVDGGKMSFGIPAHVLDATRNVEKLAKLMDEVPAYILNQVCGEYTSLRSLEKETGWQREAVSFQLKLALEICATYYGILPKHKRTITPPERRRA